MLLWCFGCGSWCWRTLSFFYDIIIWTYDSEYTILGHPLWDRNHEQSQSSWGPSAWSDGFCFLFDQTILLLYKIQFSKVDLIPPNRPSPKDAQQEQGAWGQNPSVGIATNARHHPLCWSTMAATSLLIAFGDQETLSREYLKTSIVITAKAPHTGVPGVLPTGSTFWPKYAQHPWVFALGSITAGREGRGECSDWLRQEKIPGVHARKP